ncbi:FAD-dependent oxidoreductase [Aliiglaciecola sp. LCG003]|uniref:NAD(P)/FAD-dependent oxidoreductase n=1 Tax=Aliiglaciecola sp. LCG003 TaxID=3053655 RepID=UPI00257276FD|nr:FAD-dependent oxidoreductase [Aliiglaciecola sp. LCG003]WJG09958.1 FAD-dependent oxidoreductase [Aliiglaciecola sp. LCG003]
MGKKIAIIGSGISGLTCAHLLHQQHDITVFEANDYIGGHTATKNVEVDGKHYAIDTGFIVFNDWTYPNFIKLMDKIGVKSQPTEMSFSVKNIAQNLEYNGNTLNSLFAQRRNILRPKFWRIVRDILRFNKVCKENARKNLDYGDLSLFEFIQQQKLSDDFAYNYILPMCAAIWSTSLEDIKAFPFQFFLRFFNNHGLLNITDRPQWYSIIGGSRSYIAPLTKGFESAIKLNSPVQRVVASQSGYAVMVNNVEHQFDEVIFACHSDQALAMLSEPSQTQQDILGSINYLPNEVVLHTDTSVLPKRKLAWASWNYLLKGDAQEHQAPAVLSYNMNILQCIESSTTFCVTLNNSKDIAADKILGRYNYAHPQFNQTTINAQARRNEISGQQGLHFCGAYWYNGFHEDGVRSALDVCAEFGTSL